MSKVPTIRLNKASSRPVACGHPWIYSGAIEKSEAVGERCDRVVVRDYRDRILGHGFYSPHSQIRVRMYERTSRPELEPLGVEFFARRLLRARRRRRRLGLPGEETTGFRLVNAEGDGLPGAMVDRWGDLLVFQLTTRLLVRHREEFVGGLKQALSDEKPAILEAMAPGAMASREKFELEGGWHTEHRPRQVEFRENGLRFALDTEEFQKTGHYADVRPHRRWLARRCVGRRVLDGFCYTGGFGLLAALRGAESVTCVDSSARAIEGLKKNAELNGVDDVVEAVEGKVDDFLRSAYDRKLLYDAIVLDPPKLAPRREHVPKALKVYESLVVQALRLLQSGGLLAIGSCSQAIGERELERVLGACCGRDAVWTDVVYRGTQGPDHPVPAGMEEGRYLTFVVAQVR